MDSDQPQLLHTFGALYVGGVVTFIFYGLATLQTYLYFYLYSRDGLWKKLLVFYTWLTHTAQVGLLAHTLYHYLVANFSNEAALGRGFTSLYIAIALNLPLSVVVQLFFTKRVWALSSSKPEWASVRVWLMAVVLFLVIVGHLGAGAVLAVKTILLGRIDRIPELRNYVIATASGHVASEIAITGSLCALLASSMTEFRRTNELLHSLMVYAIHRSLLTSTLTVVGAIIFATNTSSLWFIAFEFVICSTHVNSLLGALNHRTGLRAARSDAESGASIDAARSGHTHTPKHSRLSSNTRVGSSLSSPPYTVSSFPLTPPRSPPAVSSGKGGWPEPSYPPSSASASWPAAPEAIPVPLPHVTIEQEIHEDYEQPRSPKSTSPFMQKSFMAI